MKIVKKHPRHKTGPWIEAHRQDIQVFAEEHTPAETAKAFALTEHGLEKAGFEFPLLQRQQDLLQKRREIQLGAALLFADAKFGFKRIAAAVHMSEKTLLKEGIEKSRTHHLVSPEVLNRANVMMEDGVGIKETARRLGVSSFALRYNKVIPDPATVRRRREAKLSAAYLLVRLCGATEDEIVEHLHVSKYVMNRHDIRQRLSDKKGRTVFVRRGVLAVNEARM